MGYKTYPSYTYSGLEWLGAIPSNWIKQPIKYIGNLKGGAGFPHSEQGKENEEFSFHKVNAIRKADAEDYLVKGENTISKQTSRDLGAFVFPTNSIVFAKVGAALLLSRIRWISEPSCIDNNMMGFTVHNTNNVKFIKYAMNIVKFDYIVNPGAVPSLNESQMGSVFLTVPPLREQQSIATFLDKATAKIDTTIAKQTQLIELLKEKRQALISTAVTRGLDSTVAMKDSSVKWLGEIPTGWEVIAISKLSDKITNGYVGPTRNILVEKGVPYVQATHIKKGRVNFDKAYYVTQDWSNKHKKSILQEGDVLIVQTGAGTGDIGLVSNSEKGYNCHALIIVQPNKQIINGNFLAMALQSTYGYAVLYSIRTGGMHPHLNCGEVQFVKVAVPPIEEQKLIAEYILEKSIIIDALISKSTRSIELLKEKRTALICSAVTGKIDVRKAV